ncbi:Glycosyltransferase [Melia azedarach]|uniref:Glycosyltransferase n=1 Tax=Melia azedarach TaxID=155640 RepID=A0ACC1XM71_MELAZ|nr:Glycosyltransferase [Melia azedarach]
MSTSGDFDSRPHVALLPSAESENISLFLSAFPQVTEKQFHLLPFDPASANSTDPFFLQWEAIRRSAHLLAPILSLTSPPLSALITDVSLISSVLPVTINLGLPNYILFTSSARMCYLLASFPAIVASKTSSGSVQFDNLEIPGLPPIPLSSVPPALLDLNNLFATLFLQNGQSFIKSNGILINTFEALEGEMLDAFNGRRELDGLPPLYAIGPLLPSEFESRGSNTYLRWLDEQPEGSVVYVSFGSRTALSREQTKELGNGLLSSGCKFLWVLKDTKVDKEDEDRLENVLGHEFTKKIENQGLVVKNWVDQEKILGHSAIGGFVTHGGWNSLVEAVWHGVRLLVWPQSGDQKINAEVMARSGLGTWPENWGWGAERLVNGDDIGEKIKNMMGNELLEEQAAHFGEQARKATGVGGSSERKLMDLIEEWKRKSQSI